MSSLKLIASAVLIAGLTVGAQAQSGTEQSVGADRQDRVEQGRSPAPADSLGAPMAPRGGIIVDETNGRNRSNSDATEGSVGTDRTNAIRRGDDPANSQR